jgi:hypothetical protein
MRAAMTGAIVSDFEARWVSGEQLELGEYLQAVNVQRRVLATLGLERRARDVTPTLVEYLASKDGARKDSDVERTDEATWLRSSLAPGR